LEFTPKETGSKALGNADPVAGHGRASAVRVRAISLDTRQSSTVINAVLQEIWALAGDEQLQPGTRPWG
jgi:hypothetical protein